MDTPHLLATIYENWKLYQDHLETAVGSLTAQQLALRPVPTLRSVGNWSSILSARAFGGLVIF